MRMLAAVIVMVCSGILSLAFMVAVVWFTIMATVKDPMWWAALFVLFCALTGLIYFWLRRVL